MPVDDQTRRDNELFEDEVRRIARELWPSARYSGAKVVDDRERDGVFETDECIHILEATTSRKQEKAAADCTKLDKLTSRLQKTTQTKAVRGWFVTRDEPTPDQRKVADKYRPTITILSFAQFQAQVIDSREYLALRDKCSFGSVRDPGSGAHNPTVEYIELCLANLATGALETPKDVAAGMRAGRRYVLLGDFGAGKSMTLRWLYREFRARHLRSESTRFPVYINLREHFGQSDPTEVLERHARSIGISNASHLVRAWRAGFVHLLLDGFDEVTTLSIQGLWRRLQDSRYRAMEVVRRFVREHPPDAGLAVVGRAHFFDSEKERRKALGFTGPIDELSLNEFNDDQVREYLRKSGFDGTVPAWLPSRPLLVAYLAARGVFAQLLSGADARDGADLEPAVGWDLLLDRISQREAEIEAGIDGGTVRRILERLATRARRSPSGMGPLTDDTVVEAFRDICGYSPDERGMVLLQRLPGLGVDRQEEGSRSFVDEDYVDACRAGDLLEFVEQPFEVDPGVLASIECATGQLGIAIAARRSRAAGHSVGKVNAAIERAAGVSPGYLPADLVRMAGDRGMPVQTTVFIRGIFIQELDLSEGLGSLARVQFQECFFGRIGIDPGVDAELLPRFKGCFVDEVDGRVSREDLPAGVFDESSLIENYATRAATTNDVMALGLPLGTRVLLTVLKKLHQRRGGGRKESALFRGLDHGARRLVPEVLRLIGHEGLAYPSRRGEVTVWVPERSSMRRVGGIIAAPTDNEDPLLRAVAELG